MGTFTLNTSTLGGSRFTQRYLETHTGGEFRAIQLSIADTINNSDLEIHSIGLGVTVLGTSTENL